MTNRPLSLSSYVLFSKLGVIFFLGIICETGCRKVTIVPIRKEISAPLLSCWTCSHSKDAPNIECVNLRPGENITKTECHLYQPFCTTRRYEEDGNVIKFERSCTQKCQPGCYGDKSKRRCESCCTQPLCNIGNHGVIRKFDYLVVLILLALQYAYKDILKGIL